MCCDHHFSVNTAVHKINGHLFLHQFHLFSGMAVWFGFLQNVDAIVLIEKNNFSPVRLHKQILITCLFLCVFLLHFDLKQTLTGIGTTCFYVVDCFKLNVPSWLSLCLMKNLYEQMKDVRFRSRYTAAILLPSSPSLQPSLRLYKYFAIKKKEITYSNKRC